MEQDNALPIAELFDRFPGALLPPRRRFGEGGVEMPLVEDDRVVRRPRFSRVGTPLVEALEVALRWRRLAYGVLKLANLNGVGAGDDSDGNGGLSSSVNRRW